MDEKNQNDINPEVPETTEDEVVEQAAEEIIDAAETAEEVIDEGIDDAAEAVEVVEDTASEAAETVEEVAEEAVETVETVVEAETELEELEIPEPEVPVIPVEESKFKKGARKAFRWFMGILIVFGIGFLTAIFTLYNPSQREIKRLELLIEDKESQIAAHEPVVAEFNDQISGMEGYAEGLEDTIAGLEGDKLDLLTQLDQKDMRAQILNARLDIAAATLALQKDDFGESLDRLESVGDTLAALETTIDESKVDDVNSMQQRLELIIAELIGDPVTAESDMAILAANLVQLENDLFGED